jgi:membrane-bound inhibitor of C-type lysozyme
LVPRPLIAVAALLACGCNEIRYQTARLRASSPKLEVPKAASLPDRRVTYECKNGEPFDVFFTPGGAGAVMSLGGDDFALRELSIAAGKRYGDDRYELHIKEDGSVYVTLDEKRIREGCSVK